MEGEIRINEGSAEILAYEQGYLGSFQTCSILNLWVWAHTAKRACIQSEKRSVGENQETIHYKICPFLSA